MSHAEAQGAIFFGGLLVFFLWWNACNRMPYGWRWHFRMTRLGQSLLKLAHWSGTPRWLHDVIESLVYGRNG